MKQSKKLSAMTDPEAKAEYAKAIAIAKANQTPELEQAARTGTINTIKKETKVNQKTAKTMKKSVAKVFAQALAGQSFVRVEYVNEAGEKSIRDFCPMTQVFACKYDAVTGEPQTHLVWGANRVLEHEVAERKERPVCTLKLENVKKATLTGEKYVMPEGKWLVPTAPKHHLGAHKNIMSAEFVPQDYIENCLRGGWTYVEVQNGVEVRRIG